MGSDTKSLRTRIKSVNSTLHLTKAMGLVASSKIRKASNSMIKSREFSSAFEEAVNILTVCPEIYKSPYMQKREEKRTRLIVIAGDRGLAGGYNSNVFRLVREYRDSEIIPIGKRPYEKFGGEFFSSENFGYSDALNLSQKLCKSFSEKEFDRLGVIYTKYVSMMTQEVSVKWLLPLEKNTEKPSKNLVFEPDEITILNSVVPEYIAGMIIAAVRESFACEVAARRMAMDSAGKNAQQMIDDLQLKYNRARQGAITQEITEIVAGTGN